MASFKMRRSRSIKSCGYSYRCIYLRTRYRLIVWRLVYIFAMSAIKWQVRFVWLFIDLRWFTKIVCFYDVWIFAQWIWSYLEHPSKSLRAAEKSQGAAEKNKEKVEANCTGFSAVLWFLVSRNVLFWIWDHSLTFLSSS